MNASTSRRILALLLLAAPASRSGAATGLTTLRALTPATEGTALFAPLVQGADGAYYGAARQGGANNIGTIFRLDGDGSDFAVLASFPGTNAGANPEGGLVQARDGFFYGTTFAGGANGYGTLFQLTPTGAFTTLLGFTNGNPGGNPAGKLLLGNDGALYGTASFGGTSNFGTVFRSTVPSGATAVLATFVGGPDGAYPESDLALASDGSFYGTTIRGGVSDLGTVFRSDASGGRRVFYNFTGGADGAEPLRGVVQAADGNLYGIARTGGSLGGGVIYRLSTTSTALMVLYSFSPSGTNPYNSYGNLTIGSDGNLYGVTYQGGNSGVGTLFRVTLKGDLTVLYSFTGGSDGAYPRGGLTLGSDGALYGTTSGLNGQFSTVFRYNAGLDSPTPRVSVVSPAAVDAGATVSLLGDAFVGADQVSFTGANGAVVPAASFSVRARTYLEAVVPAGAVTGGVTVRANGRSGTSVNALTVNPVPPPPPALPTVTLKVKDAVASEAGGNQAKIKLTRTGDLSQDLTVIFKVKAKSTATRGADYDFAVRGVLLPTAVNSFTIPANSATLKVSVIPLDDAETETDETIVIGLKPGANYQVGSQSTAKLVIADND